MNYININDTDQIKSFKEATLLGLGNKKGLFVPEKIPKLPTSFFNNIENLSNIEIAHQAMMPYVEGSIGKKELQQILAETFSFDTPVQIVDKNKYILELFHGPTMAFKDVGARFMARCLGKFSDKEKELTVLVATSGDTGSAVAHGFFNVPGVKVVILFPKGKVSPFQEFQMTTLGGNIHAVEVDGTFDDCQDLVKQALQDDDLTKELNLSSANSINVARFLPQMLYYFFAYKQLKPVLKGKELVVSVPSGNFGNLTAGLYARAMGLPIHQFVAANNANDTFYNYLKTGNYEPKPSVQTYSNAMDVGAPSNFVRVQHLFENKVDAIRSVIFSEKITDEQVLEKIDSTNKENAYILDPHAAVGMIALEKFLKEDQLGLVLGTASPQKFDAVIRKVLPDFKGPEVDLSDAKKQRINNDFEEYKKLLLK